MLHVGWEEEGCISILKYNFIYMQPSSSQEKRLQNSVPVECTSILYTVLCNYINILVYLRRTDLPHYYS